MTAQSTPETHDLAIFDELEAKIHEIFDDARKCDGATHRRYALIADAAAFVDKFDPNETLFAALSKGARRAK